MGKIMQATKPMVSKTMAEVGAVLNPTAARALSATVQSGNTSDQVQWRQSVDIMREARVHLQATLALLQLADHSMTSPRLQVNMNWLRS